MECWEPWQIWSDLFPEGLNWGGPKRTAWMGLLVALRVLSVRLSGNENPLIYIMCNVIFSLWITLASVSALRALSYWHFRTDLLSSSVEPGLRKFFIFSFVFEENEFINELKYWFSLFLFEWFADIELLDCFDAFLCPICRFCCVVPNVCICSVSASSSVF